MDDKDKIIDTVKKRYQHPIINPKLRVSSVTRHTINGGEDRPSVMGNKLSISNQTSCSVYCIDKMGLVNSSYPTHKQTTNYIVIEKEIIFDGISAKKRYRHFLNLIGNLSNLDLEKMSSDNLIMLNYIYYCTRSYIQREPKKIKKEINEGPMSKSRIDFDYDLYKPRFDSGLNPPAKPEEMIDTIDAGFFYNPGTIKMTVEYSIHVDEIGKYGGIVYLKDFGIAITTNESLAKAENHPDYSEVYYKHIRGDSVKLTGLMAYIIDRKNVIGSKYIFNDGVILKVDVSDKYGGDLADGLYIERHDVVNPNNPNEIFPLVRRYYDEKEIKECKVIFSSYAEAASCEDYKSHIKIQEILIELENKKTELDIQKRKYKTMLIKNKIDRESYNRDAELHKIKYDIEKTKTLTTGTKGIVDLFESIFSILGLFIPGLGKLYR